MKQTLKTVLQAIIFFFLVLLLCYNYTKSNPSSDNYIWTWKPIHLLRRDESKSLLEKIKRGKVAPYVTRNKLNSSVSVGLELCTWFHGTLSLGGFYIRSGAEKIMPNKWRSRKPNQLLYNEDSPKLQNFFSRPHPASFISCSEPPLVSVLGHPACSSKMNTFFTEYSLR